MFIIASFNHYFFRAILAITFLQSYNIKKINELNDLYINAARKKDRNFASIKIKVSCLFDLFRLAHDKIVNEIEVFALEYFIYDVEICANVSHNFTLEILQDYSLENVALYRSMIISLIGTIANMVCTVNKGQNQIFSLLIKRGNA